MPIVYILKLEKGKMYIGFTNNFKQRMFAHFNGYGSKVTQKYRPINIIKKISCFSKAYGLAVEKNVTLKFAKKYGWSNVRGSVWCNSLNF
jgi:predicted GIY-YIG superfamily endonuclease|tara:strand:+ start:194 stop:463 length:270 start_codon:yes stop_codon:yes gene_type:complete